MLGQGIQDPGRIGFDNYKTWKTLILAEHEAKFPVSSLETRRMSVTTGTEA